ncbi:hypothetical protein [Prevotella corporis]|uniref:hypothetical protein n=1 Tax=Prevotella corporis TaxID=28128 RepID=UPI0023F1F3D3|nr:hypothetical protein [Prevotella corporis]
MMKKLTLCLMAAGLMAVGTASAQNGNTGKDRQNTCTTKQCVHGQVKKTTPADLTKHMKEVLNLSDQQEEKVLNLNKKYEEVACSPQSFGHCCPTMTQTKDKACEEKCGKGEEKCCKAGQKCTKNCCKKGGKCANDCKKKECKKATCKSMNACKKDMNACKKDMNACKKDMNTCKKDMEVCKKQMEICKAQHEAYENELKQILDAQQFEKYKVESCGKGKRCCKARK